VLYFWQQNAPYSQDVIVNHTMDRISEVLVNHLRDREEILFAILYGSAAEGGEFRDVDVAIWVDRAVVPGNRELAFAFDLADELEGDGLSR
jgi:predicted nucleotidyltransferase